MVVMGIVFSLATLGLLIWICTILDMDVHGTEAAVVRENSMGFLVPVHVSAEVTCGQVRRSLVLTTGVGNYPDFWQAR